MSIFVIMVFMCVKPHFTVEDSRFKNRHRSQNRLTANADITAWCCHSYPYTGTKVTICPFFPFLHPPVSTLLPLPSLSCCALLETTLRNQSQGQGLQFIELHYYRNTLASKLCSKLLILSFWKELEGWTVSGKKFKLSVDLLWVRLIKFLAFLLYTAVPDGIYNAWCKCQIAMNEFIRCFVKY